MVSQDQNSVIHRKARPARNGCESRAMSSAKALRLSLARAADTLFGLALTVATVEQQRVTLDRIDNTLHDDGLILLLDGAGAARGAAGLDQQMTAALIEVQTTGRVRKGAAQPRRATPTDAAMMAPLMDALMDGIDAEMGAEIDTYQPRGLGFGDRVEDLRSLALTLDAPEYDHFRVTADLGDGAKTGTLDLLLPVRPDPPKRPASPARTADEASDIGDVILGAPAVLDAVLARITLPLREACAFQPGQTLTLDRETLIKTRLLATGGHLVAEARLGQINGWRALRLVSAPAAPLPDLGEPPSPLQDTRPPARLDADLPGPAVRPAPAAPPGHDSPVEASETR
jgi:flagellar motor switch protein FliM